MKRIIALVFMIVILIVPCEILAMDVEISVTLDGAEIQFDVPPQIVEGRTMVPMRAIFEAIGAEIEWDDVTRTVCSVGDGLMFSLTVGDPIMIRNYESVTMDAVPFICNGRTMIPIRIIAETFGYIVEWDGESRCVEITNPICKTDDISNLGLEIQQDGQTFPLTKRVTEIILKRSPFSLLFNLSLFDSDTNDYAGVNVWVNDSLWSLFYINEDLTYHPVVGLGRYFADYSDRYATPYISDSGANSLFYENDKSWRVYPSTPPNENGVCKAEWYIEGMNYDVPDGLMYSTLEALPFDTLCFAFYTPLDKNNYIDKNEHAFFIIHFEN